MPQMMERAFSTINLNSNLQEPSFGANYQCRD
jgi:hypothetical protein